MVDLVACRLESARLAVKDDSEIVHEARFVDASFALRSEATAMLTWFYVVPTLSG